MLNTSIIETALDQSGLLPQTFVCGCCGDELDRDDHMRGHFTQGQEDAVNKVYGAHVCIGCADEFSTDTDSDYDSDDAYDQWREEQAMGEW